MKGLHTDFLEQLEQMRLDMKGPVTCQASRIMLSFVRGICSVELLELFTVLRLS
jgi:hypothetical protein